MKEWDKVGERYRCTGTFLVKGVCKVQQRELAFDLLM